MTAQARYHYLANLTHGNLSSATLVSSDSNSPISSPPRAGVHKDSAFTPIIPEARFTDAELSQYTLKLKDIPELKTVPFEPSYDKINELLVSRVSKVNEDTCLPGEDNSFFVCDLNEVRRLYQNWLVELPRVQPFYAVKCNNDPLILKTLAGLGVNFDCASKLEIETILKLGVDPSRIIYANPCKVSSFIRFARDKNVLKSTFDNVEELYKIKKFHPESELFLRIATDDSTAQCRLSTKYGAELENVRDLIQKCVDLGLNLVGVSFHVGSGASDFSSLYKATRDAKWVFDVAQNEFGLETLKCLDVGGGFQLESFKESSHILRMALDEFFPVESGIKIIAEPGRYFAASAFTLAAYVIAKRRVSDSEAMVYINDGVYGNMNCILFDHQEPEPRILYHNNKFHYFDFNSTSSVETPEHPYKVSIWGPTCDGLDCIAKEYYMKYDLVVGDWMYFPGLGAYTSSAATPFNGFDQVAPTLYIGA